MACKFVNKQNQCTYTSSNASECFIQKKREKGMKGGKEEGRKQEQNTIKHRDNHDIQHRTFIYNHLQILPFSFLSHIIPSLNSFSKSNDQNMKYFPNGSTEYICSPSAFSWDDVINSYILILPVFSKREGGRWEAGRKQLAYDILSLNKGIQIPNVRMENLFFLSMP